MQEGFSMRSARTRKRIVETTVNLLRRSSSNGGALPLSCCEQFFEDSENHIRSVHCCRRIFSRDHREYTYTDETVKTTVNSIHGSSWRLGRSTQPWIDVAFLFVLHEI